MPCLCPLQCTPDRLPDNILVQLEKWMVENETLLEGGCLALPCTACPTAQQPTGAPSTASVLWAAYWLHKLALGGADQTLTCQCLCVCVCVCVSPLQAPRGRAACS